ncbi:uncharacterized protein LOC144631727 isoform X9 [Oculina patagonica]
MNLCGVFLLVFVCQITTTATLASLAKCDRSGYKKLGCFKAKSQPLDELLTTDRDKTSSKYSGERVIWKEYEAYVHSLACRCAEATRKRGFKVFGLQNYGECWSGPGAEMNYDSEGLSDKCLMGFNLPPSCDLNNNINNPMECVGKEETNYIYRLEEPEDECSKSPCKNGATCVNTAESFRCECPQGFKGALCDQDIDECANSPCKHGATCTNTVGGFTCKCQQGFEGELCDQDINECESKPCVNGATCVNTLGGYHCRCRPGYTGTHCEKDVDECVTSPCKNGATCTNTVGGFTCKCQQGFQGKLCDQDVDECSNSPCKNGATCTNTVGGFVCKCQQGFQGKLCDQDINECGSKPCKNGATCVNTLGHYLCKCTPGHTGTHCEKDVDECENSPCKNGATCTNTAGGFTCKCQQGFQGKLCDQDINECESKPCKNGATCVNTLGDYHCRCTPGYTGTHCEQDVNECQQSPCRNGATCVNSMGSFHCLCPAGFQGKLCQQGIDVCSQFKPCKNGASCVNEQGGFKCLCPAGITGMRCELDVNECQQPLCLNGGTCVNTHGSFKCRCKKGYSGNFCEKGGCSTPADRFDLGLVIDGSGSVGNYGFAQTKMFLLKLIDQFTVSAEKTHFGVIVYSNKPQLVSQLSDPMNYHPIQLKLRILYTEFPDGKTRTDKALKMAGEELYAPGEDRNQVPNVLVVITDGNTEKGSEPYKKALKPLKDRNVSVIAVGIGKKVSKEELTAIAMGRDDRVLEVESIEGLTLDKCMKLSDMIKNSC